ncbi:MAG: TonB-dependent receptor [Clostridiales bacterium]
MLKERISIILLALFVISFFNTSSSYASGKGKLRGFVTDSTNGEPISYANIAIKGTPLGAPSDNKGYYYIPSIPEGEHTVVVSFLGYQSQVIKVMIKADEITQVDIKLVPSNIRLQEISVIGERSVRENEIDLGLQKITKNEIEMIPTGFESDLFKTIQSSAGVSSTGDVTARYYVRGGSSNQNLVLLNGVTVYNPFHALGIYSVIDPEMISLAEFNKGGFGPEYGGRLSSVLNIITRDGNKSNLQANATAGMLSGKAALEGPIPGGSFLLTGRKSYYSKMLSKFLDGRDAPFDFYDFSFKINDQQPDWLKNGKFIVHGFFSGDRINNNDQLVEDYDIKNNILGINWYQIWASPLYSFISLSYSGYKAEVLPNLSDSKSRLNKIRDITANFNFTYIYDSKDELDFGAEYKSLNSVLQEQNLYYQNINYEKKSDALSGFVKYKFYRYENFGIDLGMRVNFLSLTEKIPMLLEPRFNFTWRIHPLLSLKAAICRSSQTMTTLSNDKELIAVFEPWTILPDNLSPAEATQYMTGVQAYVTEKLTLEIEGYYKSQKLLSVPNRKKYDAHDADYINIDGESYGLECSSKYQNNFLFFKTAYSLSWSYLINGTEKYFPRYDYRHSLNIFSGFDLGEGFSLSLTWAFNSGMPYNPVDGSYYRLLITDPWDVSVLTVKPAQNWNMKEVKRLPFYHRLDIGLSKKFHTSFAEFTIDASVLNVYNRKNIFYFDIQTGKQINMLPFLPSISLRAEL